MSELAPSSTLAALDAEVEMALPAGRSAAGLGDQAARLRALMGADAAFDAAPVLTAHLDAGAPEPVELATPTIAIASGKGGVGKTNVALNLAVAMAQQGIRVTLLDADLGTANVDVLCGLSPAARLDHVLGGPLGVHDGARRSLKDIVIEGPGGFRLIPGSAGIARLTELSPADQHALLEGLAELEDDADVLIIDTAAGVGRAVTAFLDAADVCLVVSTPEPTSVADAYALVKCAASTDAGRAAWGVRGSPRNKAPRFQLVLNQCVDAGEARRVAARIGAVCDRFLGLEVPLAGWVAQDVRVGEAVRARQALLLRHPSSEAARNISSLAGVMAQQLGLGAGPGAPAAARTGLAHVLRRLFVAPHRAGAM